MGHRMMSTSNKMSWASFCGLVFIILTTTTVVKVSEAGCVKASMCCQGKDNKCVTAGARENGRSNETCFCDSACRDLSDCCTDYKNHCKKTDCVLAKSWDEWGECDTRCGLGTKQRTRRVLQRPQNGGQACDKTVQKSICEGTNCKVARAPGLAEEVKETGRILPLSLGQWRKNKLYNPYRDIRRNLFEKNNDIKSSQDKRPSYCARYELTEVRPACHKVGDGHKDQQWTRNLTKGATLCVECQSMAMQSKIGGRCYGHGAYLRTTHWSAVTAPGCYGSWIMTSQREDCHCEAQEKGALSFILV